MPSPKSGSAASLVAPTAPADAVDALDSTPGENTAGTQDTDDKEKFKPFKPDPKKKSWIEVVLLDELGDPVPGEIYKIILPDGKTAAGGSLDGKGFVRLDGIDPGSCQVTFPQLDGKSWTKQ